MKQNIFTLEELQQLKKEYPYNQNMSWLCMFDVFSTQWDNKISCCEIMDLGHLFLRDNPIWKDKFEINNVILFKSINSQSEKSRIRIRKEFLDWLIENTES